MDLLYGIRSDGMERLHGSGRCFGLANIGIGILTRGIPVWLEYILTGIFIVLWMIFFCVEVLILCAMISVAPKNMKYIIILGAQIRGKRVTEA